jgi:2-polyprenyl-3-methyl-5-hydroxy-6-metoxy-1,4-benzoquinol methylase
MIDLANRSTQEEIMDDLRASGPVIHQTLRELETINTLLGGNYVTLNGLDKLLNDREFTLPLSLADLGCGGGDILRLISMWAQRKNLTVDLTGYDANPHITDFAIQHTPHPNIRYQAVNIFSEEFKTHRFDVVVSTLFFHHFSNDQLAHFLKQLNEQTRLGIVINDLHRHWFAYYSIQWLTRMFSKSAMVVNDAPLSVARSFRRKDWQEIMAKAGITNYTLRWMWAFRWQVIIRC